MRYYHDVVTYRDLKNPGLRVRGCKETRLRVGLGGENMSTADESRIVVRISAAALAKIRPQAHCVCNGNTRLVGLPGPGPAGLS